MAEVKETVDKDEASMDKTYNLSTLSKWCLTLSGAFVVAELVNVFFTLKGYSSLSLVLGVMNGSISPMPDGLPEQIEKLEKNTLVVVVAVTLIFVLTIIVNAVWIYRASSNSRALVAPHEEHMSPGWAVGFYFIPIMSLWKPFQGMKELWNATMRSDGNREADSPVILIGWWLCFLAGSIANRAAGRLADGVQDIERLQNLLLLNLAGILLLIISAALLMHIIRTVSKQQQSRLLSRDQKEGNLL